MNRRALIIGAPGSGDSYCGGVLVDMKKYANFLTSPLGGAWRADEIVSLKNPSRTAVMQEIKKLKSADYSMLIFSGHGYYSGNLKSTVVDISDGVEVDTNEFRSGAEKHTLIIDCCRVEEPIVALESLIAMDSALKKRDASESRKYFDLAIKSCPIGMVVINSCSINETAGDNAEKGGYYSASLVEGVERWSKSKVIDTSKNYCTMSIVKAHEIASVSTLKISGNRQNPTIEKPRSAPYFPFAVIA